MDTAVQVLINGVLLGGLYALIALGLALVFGVMGVINVAHGDLMVLGAAGTYLMASRLGWPPYVALVIVIPALFVIGAAMQRFLLERINRSEELMSLLLLFGFGIAISQATAAGMGATYFSVPAWSGSFTLAGAKIPRSLLFAFLLAVVLAAILFWFLKWTLFGKAIRAASMAPDLAAATGVDVRRVRIVTFAIGTALAGAAGTLLVTSQALNPLSGSAYLLIAFAACVLGGLGSIAGAVVAGFIIALVEVSTSVLWDSQLSQLAIYVLFILLLLVRPSGLFGVRSAA